MTRALFIGLAMVLLLAGCGRSQEPGSTPLPTRQTTIDPVKKKLDAAARDSAERRQAIEDAAK